MASDGADHDPAGGQVVFSIGHSNYSLDRFLELLRAHGIEVVVDVRSQPYSKYSPHFSAPALKKAVIDTGFKYLYLGRELGGRPDGAEYYDADGRVFYDKLAQNSVFLAAIRRVERGASDYRVALMCSEENPAVCHRHRLVGRVLARRGHSIRHIRGDGELHVDADLDTPDDDDPRARGQLALFELPEETAWKSLHSVLPKDRL